jgi:hypothetical protein
MEEAAPSTVPPPTGEPRADAPPPQRRAAPSSRALTIIGPVYMLLGWLTLVVFLLMLGGALDGLAADQILTVDWGRLFVPLWVRDGAGFLFALHLLRYRSMGARARATAVESMLNVALSVAFKLNVLQRIQSGSGSIRLVCLPIYLTMFVSVIARAVKSAATPPDQRASSNLGLGIGVTHLLAITVLSAAHCLLPTAYCPLSAAHCLLPTVCCPLPAAHCLLPTACSDGSAPTGSCAIVTQAVTPAAAPPPTHTQVACKLDGVSSYGQSTWTT